VGDFFFITTPMLACSKSAAEQASDKREKTMHDLPLSVPMPGRDLEPLFAEAAKFLSAAKARSTRDAYASDARDFAAFCKTHSLPYLPSTPQTTALYITHLARRVSVATIRRRLAAITYVHREAGYSDSPASTRVHFVVREVLNGIRRIRGTAQHGADPLLAGAVKRIAAACPATILGLRDRALVLLGFSGAFRRSELTQIIEVGNLTFTPQGLYIRLPRSKTDQEQAGRTVAIGLGEHQETCPVLALRAWIDVARVESGPVFRAVDLKGRVSATALHPRSISKILKRAAARAGLDPRNISGHSLRAGATTAAIDGAEEREIARTTGHKTSAMVRRYIRDGELLRSNMTARLGL
jgi:integrase